MERRIALVGLSGPEPHACGAGMVRLWADAVFTEPLDSFDLIVLGADVVVLCEPVQVRARLAQAAGRVVLCASGCDAATILRWFVAGFVRAMSLEDLGDILRLPAASALRPDAPPERWLARPAAPGSRAAGAIERLRTLTVFSVDAWAVHAGRRPRTLERIFQTEMGLTPHFVLTRYRLFLAAEMRLRGELLDDIAAAVGYCDAPTLLRVCREHDISMPRAPRPAGSCRKMPR